MFSGLAELGDHLKVLSLPGVLQQRLSLALMSTQSHSQSQQQQPHIQAQPEAGQDVLAVACVIDASLSLAAAWPSVVKGYILPLLKRLNETYSSHQVSFIFFV